MNKKNQAIVLLFAFFLPAAAFSFGNFFFDIDAYITYNKSLIPAQNGYLMAGRDSSGAGCIVNVDAAGNCVWTRTYQDYGIIDGVMTADGYMLCTYFFPTYEPALMKIDFDGDCVWTRTTADTNTYPASLAAADDGGYIMAGHGFGANYEYGLYVEKIDAAGDCVWARSYDSDITAHKIINSGDGAYMVCGGKEDIYGYIKKIDYDGSDLGTISTDNDTGYNYAWFYDMVYTGDGYILTGQASGDTTFNTNGLLVMKMDMIGNTLNEKIYYGSMSHIGQSICPTENGADYGYLIAGTVAPDESGASSDDIDVFIMQVDTDGNCKNVVTHSDTSTYSYSLTQPRIKNAGDGKYVVSTTTYSTVWYDGYFYCFDGSVKPAVALPPAGGENGKVSYACPQPAKDSIKFVYALDEPASVTIYIYNFANRLVGENNSKEIANNNVATVVDITKLPAGIYNYQVIAKHDNGSITRFTPDRFMVKK